MGRRKRRKSSNTNRKSPEQLRNEQLARNAKYKKKLEGPLITVGALYDPHFVSDDPNRPPWV